MAAGHLTASDGFALAMLAMIASSLGVLIALFFYMRRSVRKRNQEVDALLQEIERLEIEQQDTRQEEPVSREPWSREVDWWKDKP